MLPNFIVVGAPKAGTTSLCHYLSEHHQVFMSVPKEVNYFSQEEIEAQGLYYKSFKVRNLAEYEKLFDNAKGKKAIGEGSVSYLFYPNTPEKIQKSIPHAKIVILLRNPVERGFSHYLMDYRLGLVDLTYEEIVYKSVEHKNIDLYYQQYVEVGLYHGQVKRYFDIFGPDGVKIYLQEDFRQDPESVISDLYDFLNIDKSFMPKTRIEHNVFSIPKSKFIRNLYASSSVRSCASSIIPSAIKRYLLYTLFEQEKKPVLRPETKRYLLEAYEPDVNKLAQLIGRDLSVWN